MRREYGSLDKPPVSPEEDERDPEARSSTDPSPSEDIIEEVLNPRAPSEEDEEEEEAEDEEGWSFNAQPDTQKRRSARDVLQ